MTDKLPMDPEEVPLGETEDWPKEPKLPGEDPPGGEEVEWDPEQPKKGQPRPPLDF